MLMKEALDKNFNLKFRAYFISKKIKLRNMFELNKIIRIRLRIYSLHCKWRNAIKKRCP